MNNLNINDDSMHKTQLTARALFLLGLTCGVASSVSAASLLNSTGTVALGVNPTGELNVTDDYDLASNTGVLGIARFPSPGDATAPGCYCEGWGVSASGFSGYANQDEGGAFGLTPVSFVTDDVGSGAGTYATSTVDVSALPGLRVTQAYAQAPQTVNAFRDVVTIQNSSGSTLSDVRYVRVMDWDVPPTEFSEFVTIQGTATTTLLERSHNNGFNTANPLGGDGPLDGSTVDVDFDDVGAADHGAYFRFNFGALTDGESKSFEIYYGAGGNLAEAMAALSAIGAELYSLGKSNNGGLPDNDSAVYFFAFKGVGGTVITPPVPEAGQTIALLALGLGGLGGVSGWMRRKV